MSEKQQPQSDKTRPNLPDEPAEKQDRGKANYRGSTLSSGTVVLPRTQHTNIESADRPPSSPNRPQQQPPRKVPLVPTGPHVPDAGGSPPADFVHPDQPQKNDPVATEDDGNRGDLRIDKP
jgi:hypothetical protein